jgi:hypothetical protein
VVEPRTHDIFISTVVLDEIGRTPDATRRDAMLDLVGRTQDPLLSYEPEDDAVRRLASFYFREGIIPPSKYRAAPSRGVHP